MRCSREWLVDGSSSIGDVYLNMQNLMCSVSGAMCHVYRVCPPLFIELFSSIVREVGFAAKEVCLRLSRESERRHCPSSTRSHVLRQDQVLEHRYFVQTGRVLS